MNELIKNILQCPESRESILAFNSQTVSTHSNEYPIVNGIPVFTHEGKCVKINSSEHISNDLCLEAKKIIKDTKGLVLNLSAGGSEIKESNVIEVEYSIFRNTDIVADAHNLPFKDNVFAACICMNAFEHYRDPYRVALEIYRVLKPTGTLFIHTAGIQPLHEAPHHYFNVTKYGLMQWLSIFETNYVRVSNNFNPIYALSWIISELERGILNSQGLEAAAQFRTASLEDIMNFWRYPDNRTSELFDLFYKLDGLSQEICSAGWEASVSKPA
jgi:SAM-dependent methyltransferase